MGEITSLFGEGMKMVGDEIQKDVAGSINNFMENMKNKIYSPWMDVSISHISLLLEKLNTNIKSHNFLTLLFVLQRLQQISHPDQNYQDQNSSFIADHNLETEKLNSVKRYGKVAIQMYHLVEQNNQEIAADLQIEEDDLLKAWVLDHDPNEHCPKFLVYLDHEQKSVVISIRGTWSLRDTLMDLVSDSVPFLDGWAHRGILQGARKIMKESEDVLKEAFRKFPNYNLVLCGHSLGGGVAELITLDILYGDAAQKLGFSKVENNISCYAFGAPPVFAANYSVEVPEIILLINKADVVPSISFATIDKALAQISVLESLEFSLLEKSKLIYESVYYNLDIRCSLMKEILGGTFKTEEFLATFENIFQSVVDKMVSELRPNKEPLQNNAEYSRIQSNIRDDVLIGNHLNGTALILQENGFFKDIGINVYNNTEVISTLLHEDEEISNDSENYEGKILKALKIIKNWKSDDSQVILKHPGVLYRIDDIKTHQESIEGCNKKKVLWRISPEESLAYARDIRLDIINMVLDHLPNSYKVMLSQI